MVRGLRAEQPEISASVAALDNGRISAFDNSKGYVFFAPSAKDGVMGSGDRVPTTEEIDWTGPDVPCRGG
jgi:hypothetical protein